MINTTIKPNTSKPHVQQKKYVKPSIVILITSIGALNGMARSTGTRMGARKLLDPLDRSFFDFISKIKIGENLADFVSQKNIETIYSLKIGSLLISPKAVLKGASFGAAIYIIPKLIKKGWDIIGTYSDK